MRMCTRLGRLVLVAASLAAVAPVPAADADRIDAHTPLPSTALVLTKTTQGTGFVVDREARLLITSHHVTGAKGDVEVVFPVIDSGQALVQRDFYLTRAPRVSGSVVWSDPKVDLAAICLQSVPFAVPELKLAAVAPQRGDRTHMVGNPGNRPQAWVYDTGSVQKVGREKLVYDTGGQQTDARYVEIKADGLMAPGASGGPVVNNAGELIGVLSAGRNRGRDLFCIEVGEVRRFLAGVHREQGTQALRKGDYRQAVGHCNRALQVDADDALSYNERGAANSYLDQLDDAIADYTRALKLDPRFARAYRNRGSAYFHKDKYEESVADCTRAIELNAKYASAYQVRAKAYRRLGQFDAASADEAEAAKLAESR